MRLSISRGHCTFISSLIVFLLAPIPQEQMARGESAIFSTGDGLELDRVASAWLIKRFVLPEVRFRFFPEGQLISQGIAFDTPDASLQRTHKQSTFEVIKTHYGINDPRLTDLTAMIHENEVNFWE